MTMYPTPQQTPQKEDQSIGELLSTLTQDLIMLVKQELTLAKTEMSQKIAHVAKNLGVLVAGGAIAYAGVIILLMGDCLSAGAARAGMAGLSARGRDCGGRRRLFCDEGPCRHSQGRPDAAPDDRVAEEPVDKASRWETGKEPMKERRDGGTARR